MRTLGCALTIAAFLFMAACSQSSGQPGTSPSDRIPTGPEPGSPASQGQSGAGSSGAGMPGAY